MSAKGIVARVREVFEDLAEHRRGGNNQHYTIADAALSAFSVFFTQIPSFLDYQMRMQKQRGRNNAQSLFGVHEIPSDNQIRNLLDPIPQDSLYPLMAEVGESLLQHTGLQNWRSINGHVLIAQDGTDCFSSGKISCPCCSQQSLKDDKTRYRHTVVTPVLVAPGQERVVPLPPEFIQPQDGHDKQDCELAASSRWLRRWASHYAPWGATLLDDDLYCHQPFCEQVLGQGLDFIFTCKPGSHALLTEWADDFARSGQVQTLTRSYWNGSHRLTDTYRYVNQVPLRDSDDALLVNWCELTTTDEAGQMKNEWVAREALALRALAVKGDPHPSPRPLRAGQSSPPDGLGGQAPQGFAWPQPFSVGPDSSASRVRCAGLRPPLTRPNPPTQNSREAQKLRIAAKTHRPSQLRHSVRHGCDRAGHLPAVAHGIGVLRLPEARPQPRRAEKRQPACRGVSVAAPAERETPH